MRIIQFRFSIIEAQIIISIYELRYEHDIWYL